MKELLIGRQAQTEQPRLAVTVDGKTSLYGQPGSVPMTVSRKHCRIEIDDDMKVTVIDITDNNFIYVNGVEVKRKSGLSIDDEIELGPDKYSLDLQGILRSFSSVKSFSIKHLEAIYENHDRAKMDYQIKQNKLNALSALPGLISMSSIALAFILPDLRVIMIILALIMAIAFAVIRMKNASEGPLFLKKLDEDFRKEYVCPNPLCKRFLMHPYNEILSGKACPFCKAKFKE